MLRKLSITGSSAPIREPCLREPDLGRRRLLGLLGKAFQCEENLILLPLGSKEDPEALAVAFGDHFIDLAAELLRRLQSIATHLRHRRRNEGRVSVGEFIDESLTGRPPPLVR
jgi:hypothetical protein